MGEAIGMLVEELITEHGRQLDAGRDNELRMELNISLRDLATRIDRGYHIDVRAGALPPADENAEALRSRLAVDEGGLRLGELALVDRKGRIGPLGTVFYDTLLDENAASHIAFGSGFPFLVEDADAARVNESATHVDFMIGSPELEVDGVTAAGELVPILRGGDWQI